MVEDALLVVVRVRFAFIVVVAENVQGFVMVVRAVVAPKLGATTPVNNHAPSNPPNTDKPTWISIFMVIPLGF